MTTSTHPSIDESARRLDPAADPAARYLAVRSLTQALCEPLETEDFVVQSMPDVSPAKWHIAHVTWFFETFLLKPHRPDYRVFHPRYETLFNSYYNGVGEPYPRPRRGLLSRPTVAEVMAYRSHVDEAMTGWIVAGMDPEPLELLELGLNHEQQHQELLLMDLKHVLAQNPLYPAYSEAGGPQPGPVTPLGFHRIAGGEVAIGHHGPGFCYDNETPRHRVLLEDFELADRPVSNAEYLEFIDDGGYRSPEAWLSDGWDAVRRENWQAPLYWLRRDDGWHEFTLAGLKPLEPTAPVAHLSYYEADAFARWAGQRLPTEQEWEHAAAGELVDGRFLDSGDLHPRASAARRGLRQLYGGTWEWTGSPYQPYPGFRPAAGAVGEYNGKFMCNQFVLRGGSCLTPAGHVRASYRNFFYPHQRWAMTGLRLAR